MDPTESVDAAPAADAPGPDAAPPDAAPPDAAVPDAGFVTRALRVRALIDGRSRLILRANTARWRHLDFAAPGRHEGANEPTILGDTPWSPQWPDVPNRENRNCDCDSDVFVGYTPAIPALAQTVALVEIDSRTDLAIIEQPSADNDYAVVVEIDDRGPGGSSTYVFDLEFQAPP